MLKYNGKQWALIAGCLAAAAVVNWLIWLLAMGKPSEISGFFHVLTTICLAAAFIVIADKFAKTEIYK